jgi:sugar phosphate permease
MKGKSRSVSSYRWVVFGLLACGYILVYFHRLSTNVVALDMMKDLEVGGALIGLLASGYFYPYALMQLPSGLLADSLGPRRTVTFSFIVAGLASIFLGMVTSVGWAIFVRILVGIGVSMLFVATLKILTHWFKASEFARLTGVLMALGGVGVLTTATPLAYLSESLGWRGSFVAIGLVTLALAGLIWIYVRNTPEEKGFPSPERQQTSTRTKEDRTTLMDGLKTVLSSRTFWPLAAWFFFSCGVFFSFAGLWGAPYLIQVYGLTKIQAGGVMDMLALAMIVGSPLLSILSDRIRSRKLILVAASLTLVLVTLPLAFFPAGMSRPMLYLLVFLMSLSASSVVAIGFTMSKELFPMGIAGTAVGLVNLFPFLGGALMQPAVGYLLESQSQGLQTFSADAYGFAFRLFFASACLAFFASLLLKESFPQEGH